MTTSTDPGADSADVQLTVVSDAAGRIRFAVPALRGSSGLAVAVEDAVDAVAHVRQTHAYPRTGNVVVWLTLTVATASSSSRRSAKD